MKTALFLIVSTIILSSCKKNNEKEEILESLVVLMQGYAEPIQYRLIVNDKVYKVNNVKVRPGDNIEFIGWHSDPQKTITPTFYYKSEVIKTVSGTGYVYTNFQI